MLPDSGEELIRVTPYVPNYDIFSFLKLNKYISSAISIILCLGSLLHLTLILIMAKKKKLPNRDRQFISNSLPKVDATSLKVFQSHHFGGIPLN